MNIIKELQKERNHLYFWVRDNKLYQSYKTSRGERSAFIREVIFQDTDKLSEKDIEWLHRYFEWSDYYFPEYSMPPNP